MNERRKFNEIISDNGSWVEIDISTKSYPDCSMKIDKIDLERIIFAGGGSFSPYKNCNVIYATVHIDGKNIPAHRAVFKTSSFVDHINHNGLDNRRSNLRPCTASQNSMNRRRNLNNKSGCKGVYPKGGKWASQISVNKKQLYLGTFSNIEDAISARKSAEIKYHGEYALNH